MIYNKKTPSFSLILIFIFFSIIGLSITPFLSYKLNPTQKTQNIQIEYFLPGASPKVVENSVTYKLEQAFSRLEGIKSINSVSSSERGNINIEFQELVDIEKSRLYISSIIRELYTSLPVGLTYPKIKLSGIGENNSETVMILSIGAKGNLSEIEEYTSKHIIPKLSKIKGIGNLSLSGITKRKIEIIYNEEKIKVLGVSTSEIKEKIISFFSKRNIGEVNQQSKNFKIQVSGNNQNTLSISEFKEIPILRSKEKTFYLKDFAEIIKVPEIVEVHKRINGLNSITINIEVEKKINQLKVSNQINQLIQQLNSSNNVEIFKLYDATKKLRSELKKVSTRTILSVFLLLIFVFLINRNKRYLYLIIISLTSNLSIAIIFYYFFSVDIHIYSLAGFAVSLGIVIDNSIIVIDHLLNKKKGNVFISLLATTLTTVGALSIIFFIQKKHQLYLIDFSWIIIINLSISLLVSIFFIPALIDKTNLNKKINYTSFKRRKTIITISKFYSKLIHLFLKRKIIVFTLFVFSFGLPIFLINDISSSSIKDKNVFNKIVKSEFYQNFIHKNSKYIGGTLYLFLKKNEKGFFFNKPERLSIKVMLSSPEGTRIQDMNKAVSDYEKLLENFEEVELFQTDITNSNSAIIKAYIKEQYVKSEFPYLLKRELETKANQIGGISSSIFGVGQGFSNNMNEISDATIKLTGYNLTKLKQIANHIKDTFLLKHSRISNVKINSKKSWLLKDKFEYQVIQNNKNKLSSKKLYDELKMASGNSSFIFEFDNVPVFFKNSKDKRDLWQIKNKKIEIDSTLYSFRDLFDIEKRRVPLEIVKNNNLYQLYLDYSFAGTHEYSNMVLKELVTEINKNLPVGYKANDPDWEKTTLDDNFLFLKIVLIIIGIIYFICSILFESLIQPLAVILMIPASFIGVFLTFILIDTPFDQGGFASFILLSGIVVNSSIYIINEFNNIKHKSVNQTKLYIKAFNSKITPILLTIISTILGLSPFVLFDGNDFFWTAFAYGNIGGLIFSILVLLILLPLCLNLKIKKID